MTISFQLLGCFQSVDDQRIFYSELGEAKETALKALINSFEVFLKSNYPDNPTIGQQTRSYLKEVLERKRDWAYNEQTSINIIKKMEDSGLRKDLYIYNHELANYPDYNIQAFINLHNDQTDVDATIIEGDFEDIIETNITEEERKLIEEREELQEERLKKIPSYNFHGLFIYAMAKALQEDSNFMDYLEIKNLMLELSPGLLAEGMLTMSNDQLENWENQLIVISEIYYFDLLWNYEIKEKLNST